MNRLLALCFVWLAIAFLAACDDGEPSDAAKRLPATIAGATVDRNIRTDESADRIAWAIKAVKAQGWACRNIHFFLRHEVKHFRPAFRMNCDDFRHNYNFVKKANGRWAVGEDGEDKGYYIRGYAGPD